MNVITTIFASGVLPWAQTGIIANYSGEAILNLLFASCMAGNIVLFLYIARSNTTLPVQKKVQAAHLFRILLVAASVLCVIVLVAIAFLAPEIVWVRKLLLVSLVCMTLHMNWKYLTVAKNYIRKGLATTIITDGDTALLENALRSELINVNSPDSLGYYPLHVAVSRSEYNKVKLLLVNGADVNASTKNEVLTALEVAASEADAKMVALLLGHNVDATGKNQALAVAALNGRPAVVRQLLDAGADPNAQDSKGSAPLHLAASAASRRQNKRTDLFRSQSSGAPGLIQDQLDVVEQLLSSGADPNTQTPEGLTPLHLAAQGGHRAIAEALFRAGGNPLLAFHADMMGGISAITLAWENGQHDLAKTLSTFAFRGDSNSSRLFMSYRTTDARFVRFLSEQLMAGGVPVWFDEYEISADQKEKIAMQPEEFQRAIDDAVEASTKAICITNACYAGSPYCKSEASSLTSKLPRDRILNITCPDHGQLYADVPAISGEPAVHLGKDLAELSDKDRQMLSAAISLHVGSEFTFPILDQQAPPMTRTFEWRHGVRYTLDLGGWEEWEPGRQPLRTLMREVKSIRTGIEDAKARRFKRECDGHFLRIYVTSGIALQAGKRLRFNTLDSRPHYFVEVARRFDDYLTSGNVIPKDSGKLVGIHLLHTNEGNGHVAFTHYDTQGSEWGRHYVIIVDNPAAEKVTRELSSSRLAKDPSLGSELEISIQMYARNCTFQDFCKVAYLGDRIAASLRLI
ncbi:ankyrin repeat domain-containing protein [Oligosphaera ethanolica]|uniref:Ankyrin repeat protein n=1 Tax=Oligosphaera ethanolica TaxID=760260 RepID=A0AAE4API0_9BACT|nr:ankyrin repeat domain-containing protein [Oligosphaera ethanolica]MDQ0290560.1 ankyrin repeat protein [Oligosphaera ethanolica]